jgi:hypothetical protein
MRFFFRDGDWGHRGRQLLPLPLAEGHQGSRHRGGDGVLGACGGGHDAVEADQAKEQADQVNAAGPLLREDQVEGQDEAVDKGEPLGGFEEGGHEGVGIEALLAGEPVLEGRARDAVLLGELALGECALGEGVEQDGDIGAGASRASRGGKIEDVLVRHGLAPVRVVGATSTFAAQAVPVQSPRWCTVKRS